MDGQILAEAHALEELEHRHVGQRLAALVRTKEFRMLREIIDDLYGAIRGVPARGCPLKGIRNCH